MCANTTNVTEDFVILTRIETRKPLRVHVYMCMCVLVNKHKILNVIE